MGGLDMNHSNELTFEHFKKHILKLPPLSKITNVQKTKPCAEGSTVNSELVLTQVVMHLASIDDNPNAQFYFRVMKAKDIRDFSTLEPSWQDAVVRYIENGYQLFVVVNGTDGHGVKTANITKVRALFLDLDNTDIDNLAVIDDLPIPPNLVLSTSPGKFHCYWNVKGCPLGDFTRIQKMLAKKYNGDTSVSDLPRIMRLAGSYNLKKKPHLVNIVSQHDEEYLYDDFISTFNLSSFSSAYIADIQKKNDEILADDKKTLEQNKHNIYNNVELHSSLLSLAGQWVHQGLTKPMIIDQLKSLMANSTADNDQRYQERFESIPRLVDYALKNKTPSNGQETPDIYWPEPQPLVNELKPVLPLDVEILPQVMRDLVTDSAERMQCPPDFLAAGMIVASSSIIARNIVVQPKKHDVGWLVYLNLWGVIIGKPSLLKSPTLSIAMSCLEKLECKYREAFVQKMKVHEVDCEIAEMRGSNNKKNIKKLVGSSEKFNSDDVALAKSKLLADQVDDENVPTQARYVLNDGTIEKIADLLCSNTKGLLVFRDELSGWFNNLNKPDKTNDRSFVLESWNGDKPYTIDRIGRGTTFIPTNRLSILGGIQPDAFGKVVDETIKGSQGGDGLLQRFQIAVYPDVKNKNAFIDRAPNKRAFWEFNNTIEILNQWSEGRDENLILKFDDESYDLFKQWYTDNEALTRSDELSSALESHYAKYRSLVPTIAAIFYVLENSDIEATPFINKQTTSNAISYVEYLRSHAERIYALPEQAVLKGAKTILARFDKLEDTFAESKVKRNKWTGLTDPTVVEAALALREENGYCKVNEHNTGVGRPSIFYVKHPKWALQKLRKFESAQKTSTKLEGNTPCKS